MRSIAFGLALLGVAAVAFGYWGTTTASGQRRFDEMAGMIPFAVGVLGVMLLIASAVVWWRGR